MANDDERFISSEVSKFYARIPERVREACGGRFGIAVFKDGKAVDMLWFQDASYARCPECDGTGLRGGFQVPCSRGCRP